MEIRLLFGIFIAIVAVAAALFFVEQYIIESVRGSVYSPKENETAWTKEKIDALAQCLTESGAKLYGARWCPHCKSQKAMFGESAAKLHYVECDEGGKQAQVCVEARITAYPTWVFADGKRLEGQQTFSTLANVTGCGEE